MRTYEDVRLVGKLGHSDKLHQLDPVRDLPHLGEADVLRRTLQKENFSRRLAAISKGSDAAVARKRLFHLLGRVSIFFRIFAVVAGASFILPIGWTSETSTKTVLMAVQFACLGISWLAIEILGWTSTAKNWIETRRTLMVAEAEFYDELFRDTEPALPNEPTPLLVKLDFFLFFALVVPNQYFGVTSYRYRKELAKERRKLMLYRLVGFVAIGVSIYCLLQLLSLVPAIFSTEMQSFVVFLGVIAAALSAATSTRSGMELRSETVERFSRTSRILTDIERNEEGIAVVRRAASNNEAAPVYRFVQTVLSIRSEEKAEWIAARELSRPLESLSLQQEMVVVGRG